MPEVVKLEPHYKAFRRIVSLSEEEESLEIVNVAKWISQGKGVSNFPWTEYCLVGEFLDINNTSLWFRKMV
jgi:hypothetical protein